MTPDTRLRSDQRAPDAGLEAQVAMLRARQRAGEIPRIEVGPCESCGGRRQVPDLEVGRRSVMCPTCNGSGKRYVCGVEIAAYVGHEEARALLGWSEKPWRCPEFHKEVRGLVYKKVGIEPCGAGEWEPCECEGEGLADDQVGFARWVKGLSRYGREVERRVERAIDGVPGPHGLIPYPEDKMTASLPHYAAAVAFMHGEPAVRTAIKDSLAPWALGETT